MPNDAKLGLVLGVGLVIAVAVIFFRKDPATARPTAGLASAGVAETAAVPPLSPPKPTLSTRAHQPPAGETLP